jgi:hypothetical protein
LLEYFYSVQLGWTKIWSTRKVSFFNCVIFL